MRSADLAKGRKFWKMSGSGNDFVFLDGRTPGVAALETPEAIGRLCSRTEGIGADGVVVIEPAVAQEFSIRYFNRDGSRGELCGNASLCSSRLAVQLGLAKADGFRFATDAGLISGRLVADEAEIDLQPAHGLGSLNARLHESPCNAAVVAVARRPAGAGIAIGKREILEVEAQAIDPDFHVLLDARDGELRGAPQNEAKESKSHACAKSQRCDLHRGPLSTRRAIITTESAVLHAAARFR